MIRMVIAFLLLFVVTGPALAGTPEPNDFAYGMRLEVDGREGLYEAPLTLPVYRSVTRGDLGDLCVFNGQGEVVPFAVIRPSLETARTAEPVSLPIFPLSAPPGLGTEKLSLRVNKDKSGSIISVTTGNGAGTRRETAAYLLDAGRLGKNIAALELEPAPGTGGFVRRVAVESSEDLEHWMAVVPETTVVSLSYGAHTLERRRIELGSARAPYYRISSPDPGGMPALAGVRAWLAADAREPARQWISAAARENGGAGVFEYTFDTVGRMPVDRIRVELPQENTLVNVSFFSRPAKDEPWSVRRSSLVFKMRIQGHDVSNGDIEFPPCSDRYWLMRVDRSGGGLGQRAPRLAMGWVPEKLVFVARGTPPFTLACGSARSRVDGEGGDELLAGFKKLGKGNAAAGTAVIGPRTVLGGEAALRPRLVPGDWKNAVLWACLAVGVGLLAWMAIRLHRQLK